MVIPPWQRSVCAALVWLTVEHPEVWAAAMSIDNKDTSTKHAERTDLFTMHLLRKRPEMTSFRPAASLRQKGGLKHDPCSVLAAKTRLRLQQPPKPDFGVKDNR